MKYLFVAIIIGLLMLAVIYLRPGPIEIPAEEMVVRMEELKRFANEEAL
jgi:hypothetical protein